MKNAIIFHGSGNDHTGNWFPWLKAQLEKQGYIVWVPDLPNSEHPNRKGWLKTIFQNKDWIFNNQTIMVGHSAGATFILRILEVLPKGIKIHKSVLVAGPSDLGTKPEYFRYREDLVKDPFNWAKIKKSCCTFYYFCSDNDPYECGINKSKVFQQHLGGELIFLPGEGHFNLEKGPQYKQFPRLLEKILE